MVVAAPSSGSSEWVAFADNNGGENGFEAIVTTNQKSARSSSRPPSRGDSARRRPPSDAASVSSWMKKPINPDNSVAPVAPPRTVIAHSVEHPVANKRRPPRSNSMSITDSGHRHPNPVSSDSSTSSVDRPSRGRERSTSVSRTRSSSKVRDSAPVSLPPMDSHRGRSRSRPRTSSSEPHEAEIVQMGSAQTRERSTSRTRSVTGMEHQTSSHPRPPTARSNSRPPSTSGTRRARSTSRNPPPTRSRSSSRTRSNKHKPPPSTSRTLREMRVPPSSSSSVGPGISDAKRSASSSRSVMSEDMGRDDNIGRNISFGRTKTTSTTDGTGRLRPSIAGRDHGLEGSRHAYQQPSPTAASTMSTPWQKPDNIHPRILLTATVYHNTATNLWIATINTNQKGVAKNPATASKFLKAFSFTSEKEARESAIANAPPKMLPFSENPSCYICQGKFAMFRRASHCRNCGICVCNSCSTMWPAKMIPETYNLKREANVRVCKSCTTLSASFKKALLDGDYEEAVAVYGSGNINLRTPFPQFSKKKEETMYPIHCAVEGGNLDIVRWLMEDHYCPMKVIRTGSGKKPKRGGSADQLILTSKNRSVLTIAMTSLNVDILRYLVVDNGVSIYESKDLLSSLRALEAVLLALPSSKGHRRIDSSDPRWDDQSYDDGHSFASSFDGDGDGDQTVGAETHASSLKKGGADCCIICYENPIDCVMTPCGHQVCCLECSSNMHVCPVCNVKGEFIKIFRP